MIRFSNKKETFTFDKQSEFFEFIKNINDDFIFENMNDGFFKVGAKHSHFLVVPDRELGDFTFEAPELEEMLRNVGMKTKIKIG